MHPHKPTGIEPVFQHLHPGGQQIARIHRPGRHVIITRLEPHDGIKRNGAHASALHHREPLCTLLRDPRVLAVDAAGEVSVLAQLPGGGNGHITAARGALYATSFQGHRIYRIGLDGEVSHVAGTGALGEANGDGRAATFSWPNGIAAGPQGDRLLAAALRAGGLDSLRIRYKAWKSDPTTRGIYTELEINGLGYQLMGQGLLEEAITVFELNVESYPNAFNTYDSLGEAYMNAGRREEAIANYRKSLELNPANVNAVAKLKELGAR